ncbi:MAG: M48 family metalloprotease [Opitutaceae bacterium]|nr:M48 family metalloprotease [Opitutaceae bacterium]MBP9911777.1 M48 family metalloprotease [Opitutaceae bacterium]
MNRLLLPCLAAALLLAPTLSAQFDLNKLSNALTTAKDAGKMLKGIAGIGPEEEKVIGDSVALEIIGRYGGLARDEAITRRLTLVGRSLARYSDRPGLDWRFGLLDSATVNAFSAPDGYVFITRGLYAIAESDDALAAVLSHEIAHITEKHALKIVARGEFLAGATSFAASRSSDVRKADAQLKQFNLGVGQITQTLFEKGFDPQTEFIADRQARALAVTTGYAPGALRLVLLRLQQKGGDPKTIFSTHPPLSERIKRLPTDSATASAPAESAPVETPTATAPSTPATAPAEKPSPEKLSADDEEFFKPTGSGKKKPAKKKDATWDDE